MRVKRAKQSIVRTLLLFAAYIFTSNCFASGDTSTHIAWTQSADRESTMIELGVIEKINRYSFFQTSVFSYQHNQSYTNGISAGINLFYGKTIEPYIGVGAYVTDYDSCNTEGENQKICINDLSGGVYPELGLIFEFKRINFGARSRLYVSADSKQETIFMYGFFLGYSLGNRPYN